MTVLMGTGAVYLGVDSVQLARESARWPAVDGMVVRATVNEESHSSRSGPPSLVYRPVIVYTYRVDGREYEGQRVSYGEYATGEAADAQAVVDRYKAGTPVRVHYRPGQPEEVVIETGSHGIPWFFIALGVPFLLVGLVLVVFAPRLLRRQTAQTVASHRRHT
jgi:hypothetical protein